MRPARGDSRPCTSEGCAGTMQYARESDNDARRPTRLLTAVAAAAGDRMGWMCSAVPDHFRSGGI